MYNKEFGNIPGWCEENNFLFEMLGKSSAEHLKKLMSVRLRNPAIDFRENSMKAKEYIDKYGETPEKPHYDPEVQKLIDESDYEYNQQFEEVKRQSAYWMDAAEADFLTLFLRALPPQMKKKRDSLIMEDIPEFFHISRADKNRTRILPELAEKVHEMRDKLLERVIGQEHAVQAFADGLFNSLLFGSEENREKPQAVFTFAGSPGVGKTYLAELAAEYMGLPFKRYDMTEYSGHSDAEGLVGFDYTWKSAVPGKLTSFVRDNPRCVLLFDEIEKAHPNVLQIFYQILDSGILTDKYYESGKNAAEKGFVEEGAKRNEFLNSQPTVSFKGVVIIFTSNVGRSLYESDKYRDSSAVSEQTLLNAFKTEADPVTGNSFFPEALVSRIAAGYPVLFNRLRSGHLVKIAEKEYVRCAELYKKQYDVDIKADRSVLLSLLFSAGGSTDARVLRARTERFFKREIYKLYSSDIPDISQCGSICFKAETEGAGEEINSLFHSDDIPEVILYSNSFFSDACVSQIMDHRFHVVRTPEEAVAAAMDNDIRYAVIDIAEKSSGSASDANETEKTVMSSIAASEWSDGKRMLDALRDKFPEIPVYILESVREISSELMIEFMKAGARGKLTEPDYRDIKLFADKISALSGELYLEQAADKLALQHKMLRFDTAPKRSGNRIIVNIRNFALKAAPDADDADILMSSTEKPDVRFSDVVGAESAKKELSFFADYLRNPKKYAAMGFRLPKGILLYGSPGTGKTMLAKALAGETDVTFIPTKASAFVNKYVGSGPKAVRDIFERARRYAPSIIFIDEADTIGKQRTGSESAGAEENTLNALLAEMDGFSVDPRRPVFVVAATNYETEGGKGGIGVLDEAFMRRFDMKIRIELPNKEERGQLIRLMLSKIKERDISDEMIGSIAERSMELSPAVIENIIEAAKRMAFDRCEIINGSILDTAFETVCRGEKKDWGQEYLRRTAIHESGHAVINYLAGHTPGYLTVEARGSFGGYMRFSEKQLESPTKTRNELIWNVRAALGGRGAEIVYYGEAEGLDTGASSDLKNATGIVSDMITVYGMDEEFGIAAVSSGSGAYADKLNHRINVLLSEEMKNTTDLIRRNRDKVDLLVDALLEKNRLTSDEIEALLRGAQDMHTAVAGVN